MSARDVAYDKALAVAAGHAKTWLASVGDRPVRPRASVEDITSLVGGPPPAEPMAASKHCQPS